MDDSGDRDLVRLAPAARDAIVRHARREAPRECCGLLVGAAAGVEEAIAVRNVHATPATRYLIDPAAHVAVIRRLRGTGRAVLGCYHSHPRTPAVPSATDLEEAQYPEFIWLIVSLAEEQPVFGAYRIDAGVGRRLPLVLDGG